MKTFQEVLDENFTNVGTYYSFKFGDGYELCFEKLLWDNQYYVGLYKGMDLLTPKIVIKPGYERTNTNPADGSPRQ